MKLLGIDPGTTGAACVIEAPAFRILEIVDIPMVGEDSRKRLDVPKFLAFIARWKGIQVATIEAVWARQHDGRSSSFRFGRITGALECAIEGMGIPLGVATPNQWKKNFDLAGEKADSRAAAIEIFGDEWFKRVMDHNRAEAALIAIFGYQQRLRGA
jgi:hypothetical protein